ncbi:methylated-DNA--protein-cysteine methyltransferase isoform X3 [Arvicanthis niloticus]|uniref:methylated-DNA--protein-cysteine methyltransferase isoform X3 n=1 Tax=Arvicanthis niloticus TaxID=61156 RepID=UPI00403CBED3
MLLSVCTVCKLELGRMAETCKMKYTVLDSPLGKMELSGCEQGLHGIRFLSGKTSNTDPTEAPATSEVLGGPEGVPEPLVQCTAWLEAYFREPAATEGLPLPALHHPVFQQDCFMMHDIANPLSGSVASWVLEKNMCSCATHSSLKFIHQTGVMEAAEGCEIRRNGFLPAISSPGRQPQSGSCSRRSDEKQSGPHPHPLPQGGSQ